jgi:lipopolysaccharide export system permease protein
MTISMAVLVSVLYTFSRLAGDNEVTAFRAGGVSLSQFVRPVLAAATVVSVVAFLFGDQVLSRTNHRLRVLMTDIARTKPTFSLKEHAINEIQKGRLALRAAQIDQATYRMRDVTIFDQSAPNRDRVIYADSGQLAFAPNQEDLQLTLYDGSIHDFDRQDSRMFQRTWFPRNLILMKGVGREFVRREADDFRGDREMSICELEDVALRAVREEQSSSAVARASELNGLRAAVNLPPIAPDTTTPEPTRSVYCQAIGAIGAALLPVLQAQRPRAPPSTGQAVPDSGDPPAVTPATLAERYGVLEAKTPRAWLNDVRSRRDRAHAARIRAAVYRVEFHKKYAIPAACIVFVLVGIPVALRFPGSGVGLVIGAGMAVFAVYYVGLIAGESLANRLIISPAVAMWMPNAFFALVGSLMLWQTSRQGRAVRHR